MIGNNAPLVGNAGDVNEERMGKVTTVMQQRRIAAKVLLVSRIELAAKVVRRC